MTLVADPVAAQPIVSSTVSIVILGTDAVLAALPATPVQLAHACLQAGFANVIPVSWGDELIAAATLRRLPHFGDGPVIHCSCPIVAHRLLTVGGDLRPVLLPLVPPPVAVSRYLRTLSPASRLRVTYVGACPGASDESIDVRMSPAALLAMLAERDIVVAHQPVVFESIIPPDRRRFFSQPGGLPTADALWNELGSRTLVEIGGDDLVTELAQHLFSGKNVLIDTSARLGCYCSGASGALPGDARSSVIAFEPPRSTTPTVEERVPIALDMHVPAASRTPIDVAAVPAGSAFSQVSSALHSGDAPPTHRVSPAYGVATLPESRAARTSAPGMARPVQGAVPVSRDLAGRFLPRAYIARRRLSPRSSPVIAPVSDISTTLTTEPQPTVEASEVISMGAELPHDAPSREPPALPALPTSPTRPGRRRRLLYLVIGVLAVAVLVGLAVTAAVERSIGVPFAATPTQH